MPIKVEQVTKTGLVVNDYDNKLKLNEIKKLLSQQKYLKIEFNKNPFIVKYKDKEINLCIKNISYLGIPHLEHKKRIQIPKEWKTVLQQDDTLLLGIYSYKEVIIFCVFNTTKYKNNRLNNSSAHIHTIDLYKAVELGVFDKIDKHDNQITVFTLNKFEQVFDKILFNKEHHYIDEISVFKDFSKTLETNWYGVCCYQEMISSNFNHAYQAEWSGFYLEYKFQQFLDKNPRYKKYCQYMQRKNKGSIDLDLWFESSKFFGDLKAHTIGKDLLGNDKENVFLAIQKYQKIWYIAFAHHTKKDEELGVVTKFWNQALNDRQKVKGKRKIKELDSYLTRMKNSVKLDHFVVLEINQFNKQYLSDFNQGKNSNNESRERKISIKNKDLKNDNFAIYRQKISD